MVRVVTHLSPQIGPPGKETGDSNSGSTSMWYSLYPRAEVRDGLLPPPSQAPQMQVHFSPLS